ncbi:MAG TPA: HAMP domain-containing sensor histidine kinase [Bryobacteraceae bacterium]|jgi:two-component system sensor histidine kinase CpxA|nr:HAMP domain-containing sensor histidine kinase [Bryobacteraceae bacterium]
MTPRHSLSLKISLLAFLNFVLLAIVLYVFVRVQFRLDLGSVLFTPARDRMLSVSRLLALQLPEEPSSKWTDSLAQYSSNYGVQLYLFSNRDRQLAGPAVELPREVSDWIARDSFPHHHEQEHRPGPPPIGSHPPLFFTRAGQPPEFWAGIPIPLWTQNHADPLHCTVVWRFAAFWTNPFFFDYRPWLAVLLAIIAVSVACWFPLIRGLTRTITQMTRATGQIAEGHFEIALSTRRRDELGQLSESINRMAQRLSQYVHGQRRFLSDIAHELCSPVARMQVAVGILEQRTEERALAYVKDVGEELTHMSGLINELLSFSKAQIGPAKTELAKVNVAEVARRVVEREGSPDARIETAIDEGLQVVAQPDYLYRSLANLVRNAVRYAASGGPILISASNGKSTVSIAVTDHGPGLPEEELENVFKPFYRPEFARQRDTGGAGLGLAIVRSCVEACGGVVACRNLVPHGLAVEIQLPAPELP